MSISTSVENSILDLLFNSVSMAGYADASMSETALAIGLHNADPGDDGDMSTAEADYPGYARQSTARPGGWSLASGGSVSPLAPIVFPASSSFGAPVTHWSIGKASGGANALILFSGVVVPSIPVAGSGVTVRLLTATACTLD
jgi:hypothetical protein